MPSAPDPAVLALLERAVALQRAGSTGEAESLYRQVLAREPDQGDALNLLGVIRLRAGDTREAVALLEHAVRAAPRAAPMFNNLGNALREAGQLDRAEAAYSRAVALQPGYALASLNLGTLAKARGRLEQALAHFDRAAAADPRLAAAPSGRGEVLLKQGDLAAARAAFLEAVRIDPRSVDAARGVGDALAAGGDLENAVRAYGRALALAPDDSGTLVNLGITLMEAKRAGEAVTVYRRLVTCAPERAEAWHDLGVALEGTGALPESCRCLEAALARNPRLASTLAHLVNQRQHMCDWADLPELHRRLEQVIDSGDGPAVDAPFILLGVPLPASLQLRAARAHAARIDAGVAAARARLGFRFTRQREERIRIGYLSADYQEHATAYLVAELFERHDRSRFEVRVYSYGRDDGGPTRRRIANGADAFVDLAQMSDERAATAVHEDGVHLLVDVKGYTRDARPAIAALRPAPVQLQWLAYPGTLGADWIDYAVVDPVVAPPEEAPSFTERLVRLPCYWVNDTRRPVGPVPSRAQVGLPDAGFVFCCFNQSYKIQPERFAAWMRLLHAVPDAMLWLLHCNDWAPARLRTAAQAHGIAPSRLVFAPQVAVAEHCARIACADLALDTLPYNGHTTTNDALWAGVPVVTEVGATFAGRVAASQLRAAGLPELAAANTAEYEALALRLATHRNELAALRSRLAALRAAAPLFDTAAFARRLEAAYAAVWKRFLAGAAPADLDFASPREGQGKASA